MKKVIALILAILMFTISAGAVDLFVDMQKIDTDSPPVIVGGRTMVPLRAIFEALGATVEWDDTTKTATGTRDELVIVIQIDNPIAYVNGEARELDVPAMIINSRTMVPARFISESLECVVTWEPKTSTAAVADKLRDTTLYATPTGKRYHLSGSCNGGTYYATSLAEINARGLTPCDKCVDEEFLALIGW